MKLLTFAHRGEAQKFLEHFNFKPVEFIFDGLLSNKDYFLLITGEGPQNASEKCLCVLTNFQTQISEVINLGIAGSLDSRIKKYDHVWVRTSYAHHAEKLEFKSFTSLQPSTKYDCITAYSRVLTLEEKKKLSLFANIVDRESWATASAAKLFKIPYSSLKIISDDLVTNEGEVCKFIKNEAETFSELLLIEFLKTSKNISNETQTVDNLPFVNDKSFYFTLSQKRKLQSLISGLELKGYSIEELSKLNDIKKIKEQDKAPKERTRLMLESLNEILNPISFNIKKSIDKSLVNLKEANIICSYDPNFEEQWLNLSISIKSTRDLEKIKNALKLFSYEEFKKVFEGQFDV